MKLFFCCVAAAALAGCDAGFYESVTFPARKHRTMYAITTTVVAVDAAGAVTRAPYQPELERRFVVKTPNSSPVKAGEGELISVERQPGAGKWIIFSTAVDGENARLAADGGARRMPARDINLEVKLFYNQDEKDILLEQETGGVVSYQVLDSISELFLEGGNHYLEPDGDAEDPPNRAFLLRDTDCTNSEFLLESYKLRLTSAENTKTVRFTADAYINVRGALSLDAVTFAGGGEANASFLYVLSNGAKLILNDGATLRDRKTMDGGAVQVDKFSVFEMRGGLITGNAASRRGGAVFVTQNAQFIMSGGTISGNSSEGDGSAVCVDLGSQFTMSGGVIAGNGTADGTGVYVSADSALAISGAAFISRENRVFMASGVTLTVEGALTPPPGRAYSAFLSPNRYNVGQTLVRAERPYTLAERDLAALPLSDSAYRLYLDRGEGKVDRR